MERNNRWLKDRLEILWKRYFSDVPIVNTIIIKFGQSCRTRLGSIKPGRKYPVKKLPDQYRTTFSSDQERFNGASKKSHSIITINGHFRDLEIPEFVVDAVISHEFMHYAHGFASPHERAFRHPHKGGVVNEDMKERGLDDILKLEKRWLKENWQNYLQKKNPHLRFRKRTYARKRNLLEVLFNR